MSDFMPSSKRQTASAVTARREAMQTVRPFVQRFDGWNTRAAIASAKALSHQSSAGERAAQARVLADLHDEVQAAFEEFEAAVATAPKHSRIEDLRSSFLRLLSVLGHWRASN